MAEKNWPPTPSWLSPSFGDFIMDDPELIQAYDWDDYPGTPTGEGNWLDLFLDATDQHPVGRLWINPDTGAVGLLYLENGNLTWLTKAILELREYFRHSVPPLIAFENVKKQFYAGTEETGNLSQAKVGTVEH